MPCASGSLYPVPGAAPVLGVWHKRDLEQNPPASCAGLPALSHAKLIVSLTGSFRFAGSMDELLGKVGAVSSLRAIQYWSADDKKWMPLADDASALSGPNAKDRRRDFTPADFSKGADLYYWQNDSCMGETVYRLRVQENTPDRLVIVSENTTPVNMLFVTLFRPGDLQSILVIDRVSPGVFGVHILSRTGPGASALTAGHDDTYVNRTVALYRQLAGIRTDLEPPVTVASR